MKRLNPVTALFSFASSKASYSSSPPTNGHRKTSAFDGYIDGYAYRKLASHSQAVAAIEEFFLDSMGQTACSEDVSCYLQQWNNGRSLRSIRDEIARSANAHRWD
ncbi:MAG: hypothetical protein IGS48_17520 [Oscillatoriales cyanobacterium C42_A2020_001]|nr:hypothetical protein [Leptolyngbyaceae cyanobacterium C42_A2020_001]